MEKVLPFIIIFGVVGAGIFFTIYTKFDHCRGKSKVQRGALPVDMKSKPYNKYSFKTTVIFSDGFKYISFESKSYMSGLNTRMVEVSAEAKKRIFGRAIKKHEELVNKKEQSQN